MDPSNLFSTYPLLFASSSTMPVGPWPTTMGSGVVRAPVGVMVMMLLLPMPVT